MDSPTSAMSVTDDIVDKYKAYTCDYKACKYKDEPMTWGQIIEEDYDHFLYLLSNHVGVETNTFKVLSTLLRDGDKKTAMETIRHRDTPTGQKEEEGRYLKLTCGYNGKSKGKTWQEIKDGDYSFFLWAVGNAMNREGKSFNVLKRCLKPEDQELVETTPKGEVQRTKRLKKKK